MKGIELQKPRFDTTVTAALINLDNKLTMGKLMGGFEVTQAGYFTHHDYTVLVTDAVQEHLGIKYVILQSNTLSGQIADLQHQIWFAVALSIIIMSLLAWILSRIFMKPIHQRIKQVEDFVRDTTHELNTPITALSMSVSRALSKHSYDPKILTNISISTKQLYNIYHSLSYLSFDSKQDQSIPLDLCEALHKSVAYYKELAQSKHITIEISCDSFSFVMDPMKLEMLFGNLINNAIKYSAPHSKITLTLADGNFTIQDQGIGIEPQKLSKIFERFHRQTDYAGGFGIGLSIVKQICDAYALDISIDSFPNQGTTFCINFNAAGSH